MDNQELLLTLPASKLTRKQRKERAALKTAIARKMKLLPGYALGRVRLLPADSDLARYSGKMPPGVHVLVHDQPLGDFKPKARYLPRAGT